MKCEKQMYSYCTYDYVDLWSQFESGDGFQLLGFYRKVHTLVTDGSADEKYDTESSLNIIKCLQIYARNF